MHHIDIEKAKSQISDWGLDVLVAGSPTNVCYCTGYESPVWQVARDYPRFVVIPKASKPFVVCPDFEAHAFAVSKIFRVFEFPSEIYIKYAANTEDVYAKAQRNIVALEEPSRLLDGGRLAELAVMVMAQILKAEGLAASKIGIDKQYIVAPFFEAIMKAMPHCEIQDATQIFFDLRAVKSDEELEAMLKAVQITEKAIETSLPLIRAGRLFNDVRLNLIKVMSEDVDSEPNTLFLEISPLTEEQRASPNEVQFSEGQVFRVDIGARYAHYSADFARQWHVGDIPSVEKELYSTLLTAADNMAKMLCPGIKLSDIYKRGNDTVREVDPNYGRRLFMGHSIGLEPHERPYVTPYSQKVLKPGMVVCLEVPYYSRGGFSYNIEDEYLITDDGYRRLTERLPRELLSV